MPNKKQTKKEMPDTNNKYRAMFIKMKSKVDKFILSLSFSKDEIDNMTK
jgi:hypothetical protein